MRIKIIIGVAAVLGLVLLFADMGAADSHTQASVSPGTATSVEQAVCGSSAALPFRIS